MLYEYKSSFLRDIKKASAEVQISLNLILAEIKITDHLTQIKNLKKLKGAVQAYRIKCDNYRICFYFDNETIFFTRFLPRKNVYKYFP